MGWYLWAVLVLQAVVWEQCFTMRYPRSERAPREDDGDPGAPLFLTPYIESGNIEEAQRLARVPITRQVRVNSYAGFLTVNKTYNSNHFFWYFPAGITKIDPPVIVWLQGGPGKSSLLGLLAENGPIYLEGRHLKRRQFNWAVNHHVIYIDNPVGTGFSFTNDSRGYCTDETQVGEQLYSTITQFFKLFPDLRQKKFFVTGEGYAGKYVPALAYTIHNKNPTAEEKINLRGIAIGNGWSDPEHQLLYSKHLYQIGVIDWHEARLLEESENRTREYIRHGQWDKATQAFLDISDLLSQKTHTNNFFHRKSSFNNFFYNFMHSTDYNYNNIVQMLETATVRRAIHVGDLPLNDIKGLPWISLSPYIPTLVGKVFSSLKKDYMQSVAPWIEELLDHYKVLIYNGQLDLAVPYTSTVNYLRNLKFKGSEQYKTAKKYIWQEGKDVAGYMKTAGNLLEVMVRNAGHSVPADQPVWALDLISMFTYDLPMGKVNKSTNYKREPERQAISLESLRAVFA